MTHESTKESESLATVPKTQAYEMYTSIMKVKKPKLVSQPSAIRVAYRHSRRLSARVSERLTRCSLSDE